MVPTVLRTGRRLRSCRLAVTAIRDGDERVINGQKVWNTMAHDADMAILVARTDWDAPKHAGITYF